MTALSNGNFVVSSPNWQNNGVAVGAATWVNGSTGTVAVVSGTNSLIGVTSGDNVSGGGVTALSKGNYVVSSPGWQNGANAVGAVTWGNGFSGTTGQVSANNSLVGSTNGDAVGSGGVTALTNGNYAVDSPVWTNPNGSSGAVSWGNGLGGTAGAVSATNSLVVGATNGSAGGSVTALSNGNYVVGSTGWGTDSGSLNTSDFGAATWVNGSNGQTFDSSNTIEAGNSLLGSNSFDQVGSIVTALSNGNYVVASPGWHNGTNVVGAVTWAKGDGSTVGTVSTSNSLVGLTNDDEVGGGGVTALTNGNYVVSSPGWQNSGNAVGAVTWANGGMATVGTVAPGNSLIGSTPGDEVGLGNGAPGSGVIALSNGNYVVVSPNWQNGGNVVGAVTLASGTTGKTVDSAGVIDAMNSLMGSTNNDQVGSGGVTALTNGNYVVSSPFWHNGSNNIVGAVTWAKGDGTTVGAVTVSNSLTGQTNSDFVGSGGVTALSNGNYVVISPNWQGSGKLVGAATWSNGTTGKTSDGTNSIDNVNSLISPAQGAMLQAVVGLPGGNTFVASFSNDTNNDGATVVEVQVSASTETFATAASGTLYLSPSFITATLNTGTAVILQASNDITVNSAIAVNNPNPNAKGGDLTLQAGNQILINAPITTDNGNLTLIANDTAADGVIDSERQGGTTGSAVASITMTAGTFINAGKGNVSITLSNGAGNSNFAADDITLGDITANNVTLVNNGLGDTSIGGPQVGGGVDMNDVTATGNLTIQSSGDITQSGANNLLTDEVLTVGGTTSLTSVQQILLTTNANVFTGAVTYTDGGGNVVINATGNLTLATNIAAATLTTSTTGILTTQNFFVVSGASSFTGGTIRITGAQTNLQGPVTLSSTGAITVDNVGALTVENIGDLTAGNQSLAGAASLNAPSITIDGTLNVGSQTLTLTSTGAGLLDGNTTLAGGTISDSNGLDIGSGTVLSGSGTLQGGTGGVLAQVGATLSPGLSTSGGLTVDGDLTLSIASVLDETIDATNTQTMQKNFSELNVNGNVNLGNATLEVSFSNYVPVTNDPFDIVNVSQGSTITNTFSQGNSLTVDDMGLSLSYGGAGNDVVLTVLGPPAPVAGTVLQTVAENSSATTINVLASDSGTDLQITGVTQGTNGGAVATIDNGQAITYKPASQFFGVETFTYTVTETIGANMYSANGTVIVLVSAANEPPVVTVPVAKQFVANTSLPISGISVTDPQMYQGPGMSTTVQTTLSVQYGTLTVPTMPGFPVIQDNGTNQVVFTASVDVTNLILNTVTYHANLDTATPDALSVSVDNLGNFGAGGPSTATQTIALTPQAGVFKVADPTLTGKQDLVIQGSAGQDIVSVALGKVAGAYAVTLSPNTSTVTGITGRILVFGEGGNDSISFASTVKLPTLLVVGATGSSSITGDGGTNTLVESGDVNFKLAAGSIKGTYTLSKTQGQTQGIDALKNIQQVRLTATGSDNHTIDGSAFSGLETLMGSAGNDTLQAGSGNDVLVGGWGNDSLVAGAGKDLLIAAGGADTLMGKNNDLMIGGSTIYDNNVAALNAIMAEWTSLDSYALKIARLTGTSKGGKNGSTLLTVAGTSATVQNNGKASTLSGTTVGDWFFASAMDTITTPRPPPRTETVTMIPS